MVEKLVEDLNVVAHSHLPTPAEVKQVLPADAAACRTVVGGRRGIEAILERRDPRLLMIVGPCSIHDPAMAMEYARRLRRVQRELADTLFIVMRVYFEKPRTTVGWKGYINDPRLDHSFHVEEGLYLARELLLEIAALGLPTATEALDPIVPQYIGDLVSWTAVGARTTESQVHREMASGLSTPVGFKNGTDGSLEVAINALRAAALPHRFLGIDQNGQCCVLSTRGNRHGHVVLRGGNNQSNYDAISIGLCEQALQAAGLPAKLLVDCSHANSKKDPYLQPLVLADLVSQIGGGNRSIIGAMLESHLEAGQQALGADPAALRYGVSITDACLDWATTEQCLRQTAAKLKPLLEQRLAS